MQAVINLSGEGTRLRPMSCQKCTGMLDIADKAIAHRLITWLVRHKIDKVVIVTGYMPEEVEEYFKNTNDLKVDIKYIPSTMQDGVLRSNMNILDDTFLYISTVVYADFDLGKIISFHKEREAYITVLTSRGINEGVVSDKTGRVTRVEERRMWNSLFGEKGSGMYILSRDVVRFMPEEGEVSLPLNVLPALVRAGKAIYSKAIDGVCERIYDFASYQRASFAYLDRLKEYVPKGIKIEEGACVEKGALLEAPCYIGKNAHVHKGAKIGAYTLLGEGSVVQEGASCKRCIIQKGCRIGKNAVLRGCIIDAKAKIGESATIYEQAVIGENTSIGKSALIKSFVKIWPEKTIDKNVTVSENIMWGQKKRSRLFEKGKIKGVVNVDITPALCTLLGECAGAVFQGGDVGVSTDGSPAGVMLRDAVTAGLLGSGCKVFDFGEQPLPITRRGTAFYMMKGSVCITVHDTGGEDTAEITIIGADGIDIGDDIKQKLEEYFEKGDIIYPESKNIKECEYIFEYKLYYLKSIIGYKKRTGEQKKVLLSCPAPWGRRLLAAAMADFSCSVSMYSPQVTDDGAARKAFTEAVGTGGFDIGFILDPTCEKLSIAIPGKLIEDEVYEALTSLIVMKKHKNAKIYVPSTASSVIDEMAQKYGCDVVRTRTAPVEIMRNMKGEEKYLEDEYVFRFDAVAAVVLIMDYILTEGVGISTLLNELPPITMARTIVEISPDEIDRALDRIQQMKEASKEGDSVKITFDKGWVRVIPDAEKESFEVVGEGVSCEFARELCDICVEKLIDNVQSE